VRRKQPDEPFVLHQLRDLRLDLEQLQLVVRLEQLVELEHGFVQLQLKLQLVQRRRGRLVELVFSSSSSSG